MMKFSTRPYLISVLALAAALVLSVAVGSVFIPPAALWDLIRAALTGSQPLQFTAGQPTGVAILHPGQADLAEQAGDVGPGPGRQTPHHVVGHS